MSIKRVCLKSEYPIEAIVSENSQEMGVVICHPHPLYGGDMHNNVVKAIEEGFSMKGYSTIRFNFRGVGGSAGYYDEGRGEAKDALAAVRYLRGILRSGAITVLAGYSFGAWVCTNAILEDEEASGLFLVSYPFAFYPSDPFQKINRPVFFIGGEYDDIGPIDDLLRSYNALTVINKSIKIIPTDHFYWGKEKDISDFIVKKTDFSFH